MLELRYEEITWIGLKSLQENIMAKVAYNGETYTGETRADAYTWALEAALTPFGSVDVHFASTGSSYITVTAEDEDGEDFLYTEDGWPYEYIVRIGDHDARGTCDADLVLGLSYTDRDIPTILAKGAKSIDQVVNRVKTWYASIA